MVQQFVLIAGRTTRQGTSLNEGKWSAAYLEEVQTVWMCPHDMAQLGIKSGQKILLRSNWGQVEVVCQAARPEELPSGVLFMAYGEASSQLMGAATHATGMPDSKGLDVEVIVP